MNGHSKSARVKRLAIILVFAVSFIFPLLYYQSIPVASPSDDGIQILYLMDHDYGANYHHIRPIMEDWGWEVTIAGSDETLDPCTYQASTATLDTDVLLKDITDFSDYDAISILPGNSHQYLMADTHTHDLIQDAVSSGIVVSAWCKGVRVLAAADVIDGLNVTGNADYEDEYIAAGANYLGIVPPVIQGNIVTGVRSRYYRQEMCDAIAEAVGVYEEDAPTIDSVTITPETIVQGDNVSFVVAAQDQSIVTRVEVRIYHLSSTGERVNESLVNVFLSDDDGDGTFTGNRSGLELGEYTIDVYARDMFRNQMTYSDIETFVVVEPMPILLWAAIGGVVILVVGVAVFLKTRA